MEPARHESPSAQQRTEGFSYSPAAGFFFTYRHYHFTQKCVGAGRLVAQLVEQAMVRFHFVVLCCMSFPLSLSLSLPCLLSTLQLSYLKNKVQKICFKKKRFVVAGEILFTAFYLEAQVLCEIQEMCSNFDC